VATDEISNFFAKATQECAIASCRVGRSRRTTTRCRRKNIVLAGVDQRATRRTSLSALSESASPLRLMRGVLTWQHRIARVRERCRDLFGREGRRWRVVRTSNAYVFRDHFEKVAPHPAETCGFPSKSQNPPGTLNPVVDLTLRAPAVDADSPLERGLASLGAQEVLTKGWLNGRSDVIWARDSGRHP
jgi:hypothetical protein